MRGWKDRILASAMLLVLVGIVGWAFVTSPPQEEGGFAPHDYPRLASEWPGGTYVPQQDPHYYRVCVNGYWQRLYPSGRIWWTQTGCWK